MIPSHATPHQSRPDDRYYVYGPFEHGLVTKTHNIATARAVLQRLRQLDRRLGATGEHASCVQVRGARVSLDV